MKDYLLMAELNRLIVNDLVQAYKDQYGEEMWIENLTRNLRPSPNQAIAVKYGVSKNRVIQLKHSLWRLGIMLQQLHTLPEDQI